MEDENDEAPAQAAATRKRRSRAIPTGANPEAGKDLENMSADEIRARATAEGRRLLPEETRAVVEKGERYTVLVREKTHPKDSAYVLLACINGVKWWGRAGRQMECPKSVARVAFHAKQITMSIPPIPARRLVELSPAPQIAIRPGSLRAEPDIDEEF